MLTFTSSEGHTNCFRLLGTAKPAAQTTNLITENSSLITSSSSLLGGMDICSFYSGPSDEAIMAFGESYESCGSVAYAGSESCGSVAYAGGGESCGSVASSSGSFSGGGCSYCC